ncbi:MAG TPA: hypothetical protein VE596_02905 [Gaiellaceae bacterium]|jgi:hypothetical protein|nr:hypothetical protein [Gaiellaceae bacterium]
MLYLDTETRRQLSRERAARLAEDYRKAQGVRASRVLRLDVLRACLARLTRRRVPVAVGPGISLGPRP